MKVLIIENDSLVLEGAIQTLTENSTDIVHVNNYNDACSLCQIKEQTNEFDLIILPMTFARARPLSNAVYVPHKNAGCMFLSHLARQQCTVPVLIFSPEEDYLKMYKNYLFPGFADFSTRYDSHPCYIKGSDVGKLYDKIIAENERIFAATTFVIGHARNSNELIIHLTKHLGSI